LGAQWGGGAHANLTLVVALVTLRKRNTSRPLSAKSAHKD
jgi:hypothetical protein